MQDSRSAHLRAVRAEAAEAWHVAVQHYLLCLELAQQAGDERAIRFYAARLSLAYRSMSLPAKAGFYRLVAG